MFSCVRNKYMTENYNNFKISLTNLWHKWARFDYMLFDLTYRTYNNASHSRIFFLGIQYYVYNKIKVNYYNTGFKSRFQVI